uniref:Glycosyltransferase RgtA/B/C/D-like domain-containing protein n=1 Tax=Rhodopseudomonas palustris (strain BisA53) TaxID=316055 RepID=Q07TF2_RHOP5
MASLSARLRLGFEHWLNALLDSQRQQRAVIATLAVYAAIWTAYRAIATWPRDIHADVSELYGWSRELAFGYDKHPPLSAAVAKLWLLVFPVGDLSLHLLATANIAVTLYIAWRTMRRYLSPDKTVFGLALLMLIPFFNFIALKYNANAVLLPLWALTIDAFLRAYDRRKPGWAAAAGAFAALAMLGKYWSVVLVGALGLAALVDSRRAAFFRSPAPWVMAVVGLAVLAPHLWWLVDNRFPTFAYAAAHSAPSFAQNLAATASYLAGCLGYIALPLLASTWLLRPSGAALRDVTLPADPHRRLVLFIQLALIVLPVPFALAMGLRIVPLWTMPAWTLLPIVLLASPLIAVGREAVRRIVAITALFTLAMLAAAPGVALAIHLTNPPGSFEYASLLAEKIEQQWNSRSATAIPLVAGDTVLAANTAFYLRTTTRSFATTELAQLRQAVSGRGAVLVCPATDEACLATVESIAGGQSEILRSEVRLSRPLFGFEGATVRDVFWLVLPASPSRPG